MLPYLNKSYDSKKRFCSYWHQINEIINLNPHKVLEIGVGNGFTSKYLKEKKVNIITLDIDKKLNPDVVGSAVNMPFGNSSFDVVACYEVLEHLPYENFPRALTEIYRVSNSYVILSLPDISRVWHLYLDIPWLGEIKKLIPLPPLRPVRKIGEEHYWEIGDSAHPFRRIINDIKKAGFKIEKTYRVFENPYHRFFILKPNKPSCF